MNRFALLSFVGAALALPLHAGDSLLFKADFDAYSVKANFAKGEASARKFGEESLQLRMWPGAYGNVNSLAYSKGETCAWALKDNFDPRQGTVSFWVSSLGWKPSAKVFQWLFTARQHGFVLHIYKYVWGEYLMFYIEKPGADGKPRRFTASAHMPDDDWTSGRWHKIDATWNSQGMKLFVDGILPKDYRPKKGAPAVAKCEFAQPVEFPEASGKGEIVINANPVVKGLEKDERTAIDGLEIRSRALSAAEIYAAYTKVVPSKFGAVRAEHVAAIPSLHVQPVLDGRIGEAEWNDATRVPIANIAPFSKIRDTKLQGEMYVKRDSQNLYFALSSGRCAGKSRHFDRDANLWEDDVFELVLQSSSGEIYHFIVNSNGALYDERCGSWKWNSNAICKAKRSSSGWTAEVSLPFADIGGVPTSGNVGLSSFSSADSADIECVGWAPPGGGGYVARNGLGKFVETHNPLSILSTGSLDCGEVLLKVAGEAKFTAYVESENGEKTYASAAFPSQVWSFAASAGKHRICICAQLLDGTTALAWEKIFYVRQDIELAYDCHSREGFIEVRAELSGALAAKATQSGVKGELRLVSADDGKVAHSCEVASSNSSVNGRLPIDRLQKGKYFVEAEFEGVKGRKRFIVPDLAALKRKVGLDGSVPPPWIPVARGKGRSWRVLEREYFFENSPLPVRIASRCEDIFIKPPELCLDGRKIEWMQFKVEEERAEAVKLSGRGKCGIFSFDWSGELWFDGMYLLSVKMLGKGTLQSLTLDYAVPEKFARYVFKQGYRNSLFDWKDNRIGKIFDPKRHPENSLHWTSGMEKGFAFGSVSDANWANRQDEENVVYEKSRGKVTLTAKIISRSVEVKKPLDWKFVFQATPSRRADATWRAVNINGYFVPTMQNRQFGGYGEMAFADKRRHDRWTTPSNLKFRWPEWFLSEDSKPSKRTWKSASHLPFHSLAYCMPMHIGTNEGEFDYFFHDAVKLPSLTWSFREDGVAQTLYCVCDSRIWDIHLANLEWFLANTKATTGIYNDCAHVKYCENPRHGHGGLDAFGKSYSSVCWLEQREYFLREFRLMKKYGRNLRLHSPSADFVPFVMSFCDEIWTGEEFYASVLDSLECYTETVRKEEWQSAFNTDVRGVPFHLLAQYGRAAGSMAGGEATRRMFNKDAEWAERTLAACIVHDVPVSAAWIDAKTIDRWWVVKEELKLWDAKFVGYWQEGAAKGFAKGLLVSYYKLSSAAPYRFLAVVSNFSRDNLRLGSGVFPFAKAEAHEFWSGRDVAVKDIAELEISAKKFILLGVR